MYYGPSLGGPRCERSAAGIRARPRRDQITLGISQALVSYIPANIGVLRHIIGVGGCPSSSRHWKRRKDKKKGKKKILWSLRDRTDHERRRGARPRRPARLEEEEKEEEDWKKKGRKTGREEEEKKDGEGGLEEKKRRKMVEKGGLGDRRYGKGREFVALRES